ncbi:hypothetical protein FACS1894177_06410 [Bacteroidia bacterium]|nr:hypothetical protein FACS1894177_06410 [Bacteroidia bacterium]
MITEFAKVFHIREEDILSRSRKLEIIDVRKMYFFRLHELGFSYSKIGRLSGFDHVTVLNAVRSVKGRLDIKDKTTEWMYLKAKKIQYPENVNSNT